MTHPLMEIRFFKTWFGDPDRQECVAIQSYHIPRAGDMIDMPEIGGKVISVVWHATFVGVFLKGENDRG